MVLIKCLQSMVTALVEGRLSGLMSDFIMERELTLFRYLLGDAMDIAAT